MLTASEKKTLTTLLDLATEPEQTFTLHELTGFIFGLAITPDVIDPSDWLPIIFGGEMPEYHSTEQAHELTSCLISVYNKHIDAFQSGKLEFPFTVNELNEDGLERVYEWTSGFDEAIYMREELWDPEENSWLPEKNKEELYHSMMTIQGLVDTMEVMDFFDSLPDEAFEEVFPGVNTKEMDRESLIQLFLLSSLPLAVETFLEHAKTLKKRLQKESRGSSHITPIRSNKIGRNEPCPCDSGKKFKKCCGGTTPLDIVTGGGQAKKSNVIKVDFPQHGTKKESRPAPTYQLKIGIKGAKPPIWRRIQVPGNTSLAKLHEIIQICMGWTDIHLHQFMIAEELYSPPETDDSLSRSKDEAKFTLHGLGEKIQPRFQYVYDFGDNWTHQIDIEKTISSGESSAYPKLITGRRACPPEDSGGIGRYMHMLAVQANPLDEKHDELPEWFDDDFDPTDFNKEEIAQLNKILKDSFPTTN